MKSVGLLVIGFAVSNLSSPAAASKLEADPDIQHNESQL
jgi:hypothetical protein